MNLQFYLEKLKESDEFRNFCKSNPDCFLTSGFFVIDKISDDMVEEEITKIIKGIIPNHSLQWTFTIRVNKVFENLNFTI